MLRTKLRLLVTAVRRGSYYKSEMVEDLPNINTGFEKDTSVATWSFVERCLAPSIVPIPKPKQNYPSGWKPQITEEVCTARYFVERTRNHMMPVYLIIKPHGPKKHTKIGNIKGDIYKLRDDLLEFLQPDEVYPIRSQVNEYVGYIRINGDHVNAIKYWLTKRNF